MVSGRPGGNPNIVFEPKTGPKTKEGKLRSLLSTGKLRPYSKSKVLNYFKHCDKCPLRPRVEKRIINDKERELILPSKCASYKVGGKCIIDQKEMIDKLDYYFRIGKEMDSLALQEMLTYGILENAELSKGAEIMKSKSPGFYTAKFQELASKNLESLNKIKFGEKITSQNLNINVDLTDALVEAYKKRKEQDNGGEKNAGNENN